MTHNNNSYKNNHSKKQTLNNLAIFTSVPFFKEQLHVGRPNIGDCSHLMERLNKILDRRWLTNNGPNVQEFEKKIAEFVGVKHCIAVCNATIGLEVLIRALGLKGEVIIPSFTFIATAHALKWQELNPIFCDINPKTHNIDVNNIEKKITSNTTSIIGVHLWGRSCNIEALIEIAKQYQLKLIFDAAHAFGCSYRGKMIGGFGEAEVFSFHATKFINSFEGGAIVTNNDALADRIRLMVNFGFSGFDNVICIGTNGKMTEIAAAMGITSLESIDDFITRNYQNYKRYQKELSDISGIRLIAYDEAEKCNYQYIVLEIDEIMTGISRDILQKILWAENVLARRYFYPGCHFMEPYRSYFPKTDLHLPETDKVCNQVLVLPTGTAVSTEEIKNICQVIRLAVYHSREIMYRMDNFNRK